ncbi:MAG: TetR/AcrR family transcriptional regulator [Actinomycetota bacterium]|nr:TetR/AcrR family transcriptional regulator [Actinomycetota bacterium]
MTTPASTPPSATNGTDAAPRLGGVRARARAQFMADLLAVGRARLDSDGPAGLSLRAVARELGVSSSAVYRYVDSRDALLTALIIEAYDEVGAECERAMGEALADDGDPGRAWLAVGHAFRTWALAHRSSFELIYGTPIRGYAAPRDTVTAAARLWLVIETVLLTARDRGLLDGTGPDFDADGLMGAEVMDFAREFVAAAGSSGGEPPSEREVARSVTLWVSLVGAVSAEVFGHLHRMTTDFGRLFEVTLATAAAGVGLRVELD